MQIKAKFKETEIVSASQVWRTEVLSEAVTVSPPRVLKKNIQAVCVSMADIKKNQKSIHSWVRKRFKGGAKFHNGDTLMARITPCLENGKTVFVDILKNGEVGFGSTEFIVMCGKEGVTRDDFVYYLSRSPKVRKKAIQSMIGTSGRQRVQNGVFDSLHIALPSLSEQSRIAKILSDLDAKIELNIRMNKTLEAIAQAIFKRWFVDFEFPNEKGKPYKSSGGKMIDSELGEIPEGWKKSPFSKVIQINPSRKLRKGEIATKVGMSHLTPWQSWIDSFETATYTSGQKFQNSDTLFARITPSLEHGKTAFVSILNDGEVGFGSTEFIVLTPGIIHSPYYVFCLARTGGVREVAIGSMTGTSGRQRVPNDCFDHIDIALPKPEVVKVFHSVMEFLFQKITLNANVNYRLKSIRDSLLPCLMSGKIRVKGRG